MGNLRKAINKVTYLPGASSVVPEAYERQPYVMAMNELISRVKAIHGANLYDVDVRHDNDCPALLGDGHCRCQPDLYIHIDGPRGTVVGSYKNGVYRIL